jgi:hypothetical protein
MDIAILDGVDDHWDRLVWASAGGTIFHTLRFLSYHHPSKFDFANFAIRRNGQLACVIPGGRVREEGRMVFRSPLGASFGGFVFKDHRDLGSMSEMVAAFTARLKDLGFDAIEMTVPPCCYAEEGDQGLAFVLTGAGYALAGRDATSVVKLAPEVKDKLSPAALRSARKAERSGVRVSTEGEPGAF